MPFYHEQVPTTVRVAQAVGITASAFLCGQMAGSSYQLVPSIMQAPAPLLARQFKKSFEMGITTVPGLMFSSLVCAWLATREPISSSAFKLYTAAAVLLPSCIPYTLLVMKPIQDKLCARADSLTALEDEAAEAGIAQEDTVHGMVDKWATLNLGRTVINGVAALCVAWATISKVDVVGFERVGLATGADRLG
ncbi:hypothetical protein K490DRAFT_32435 [Saccharata proteae CBS 121410]|uniref:DUF1772-domain-containing protein n=1 Tax=Saccharata proteae CBS 121410 TaxID=1314787 RepID=A0A9P4I5A4_9PEZI|nr:hypothetical protein K490DRAFT_32435 [Saccharata proteae CBS 121410]